MYTRFWRGEEGKGALGCLVTLLITLTFVLACFRVVPVYLDKLDFEDDLARLTARAGSENLSSRFIRTEIHRLALMRHFEIGDRDIKIDRSYPFASAPQISIHIVYRRPIDFVFYHRTFEFSEEDTTLVGRL